jgi:hypothetical protein
LVKRGTLALSEGQWFRFTIEQTKKSKVEIQLLPCCLRCPPRWLVAFLTDFKKSDKYRLLLVWESLIFASRFFQKTNSDNYNTTLLDIF